MNIFFTLRSMHVYVRTCFPTYVDEDRERIVYKVYIYIVCTNELYNLYIRFFLYYYLYPYIYIYTVF